METKNMFIGQIEEWKKRSERREVCGIFGCETKPEVHCHRCGNWYCKEHSHVHFHMMKVPENPYRNALASMYIEKYLGKPEGDLIKKAVNGKGCEMSLDFYIGAERMINNAIQVFMTIDEKELHGAGGAFSTMLSYVSYEIERLSALKNEDWKKTKYERREDVK